MVGSGGTQRSRSWREAVHDLKLKAPELNEREGETHKASVSSKWRI